MVDEDGRFCFLDWARAHGWHSGCGPGRRAAGKTHLDAPRLAGRTETSGGQGLRTDAPRASTGASFRGRGRKDVRKTKDVFALYS